MEVGARRGAHFQAANKYHHDYVTVTSTVSRV